MVIITGRPPVRFVSVAEVKSQLSAYLARARRTRQPIVVTHHGKPYALIQPISEEDLAELGWQRLAEESLRQAWEDEDDALYDYL
jgi:prevent-host-death family protein